MSEPIGGSHRDAYEDFACDVQWKLRHPLCPINPPVAWPWYLPVVRHVRFLWYSVLMTLRHDHLLDIDRRFWPIQNHGDTQFVKDIWNGKA